jgi:hypothetical protein
MTRLGDAPEEALGAESAAREAPLSPPNSACGSDRLMPETAAYNVPQATAVCAARSSRRGSPPA